MLLIAIPSLGHVGSVAEEAAAIYYRSLTIDHTQVPSTQVNFPVLVNFTDATLKTIANGGHVSDANGYDIGFFSDSEGTTPLDWEVERYNASTGEVVAWVKIASVSSSNDKVFYMRYGDDTITTDQSDPVNTWSNGFISVYHLGNGTTLSVADSLGANNGTNTNGVTAAAGQVDGCGSFASASTQYVALGAGAAPISTALTYSAWIKATSYPNSFNGVIVNYASSIWIGVWINSSGNAQPFFALLPSGGVNYTGSHTLSTGTWYHVVVTWDSVSGMFGYIDGAADGNNAATGSGLNTASALTRIGGDGGQTAPWNGQLDEVRIASVSRTANWVTCEYNNQATGSTFVDLGTEVDITFSPNDITGLKMWLCADAITSLNDGDPVALWTDQSSNGYNLGSADANKATYETGVINGLPVIRFNGTNNRLYNLSATDISVPQPNTLFLVCKQPSTGATFAFFWGTSGQIEYFDNSGFLTLTAGGSQADNVDYSGAFHCVSIIFSGGNGTAYVDGALRINGACGSSGVGVVALATNGLGNSVFYAGDIAEVLIYDSALSSGDRVSVETYLMDKYAL